MAEQVKNLKCRNGHEVEVHYEDKQQADYWQCPECVADPEITNEDSLVKFRGSK